MAVLEFKNVTKNYGNITALKNVSFQTREGEFLVILGPSGAGKTTTLKITCGLVNPNQGEVFLDGEAITKKPPYARDISMTFENYSLYPHMSVFENMAYPLRAVKGKYTDTEIKERVESVAKMLHIEMLLNRLPAEASGGQKQRIALGRTMVRKPRIYLLDEPLAHLDAKIRVELREEFHRIEALQQTTTVYVTHDYIEALSLGDRIMILHEGELLQIGTPEQVYNHPLTIEVARQVGQPAINQVRCIIKREGGTVKLMAEQAPSVTFSLLPEQVALLRKYNRDTVLLGIRPKDIDINPNGDTNELDSVVDVFQPLGSEGVLTCKAGELTLICLIDPESRIDHNQKVKLYLNTGLFYFFDDSSKKNLAITLS
jgi:multiple sugar transport system ATP-binding protein